jgi:Uma2 family endonuclease
MSISQLVEPGSLPVPFKLNLKGVQLSEEQFLRLCEENPDLRLELTAQGELVIMPPIGFRTGQRNNRLSRYLDIWAEMDGTGVACDSSTLFALPNGAKRSPDASWVKKERFSTLTEDQQEGFLPLCPDFVGELRSPTDRLADLQEKMREYIDNGARLGWLIDPFDQRVYIYRPNQPMEEVTNPDILRGDPVFSGFALPVRELW